MEREGYTVILKFNIIFNYEYTPSYSLLAQGGCSGFYLQHFHTYLAMGLAERNHHVLFGNYIKRASILDRLSRGFRRLKGVTCQFTSKKTKITRSINLKDLIEKRKYFN